MKTHVESLRFAQNLRGVRLTVGQTAAPNADQAQAREQESYERGVRDGEKSLREQLLRQRNDLIGLQNGVLNSLRQALPGVVAECEKNLIQLTLELAQKLVAGLPISVEMVEAVVREAVSQLEESTDITVYLHAEDLALIEQVNSPVLLAECGGERLRFAASPEVSRGGCLVQSRFGAVDARRETKAILISQALQS